MEVGGKGPSFLEDLSSNTGEQKFSRHSHGDEDGIPKSLPPPPPRRLGGAEGTFAALHPVLAEHRLVLGLRAAWRGISTATGTLLPPPEKKEERAF